ncbi:Sister chromatid cohesion protein DCC1 [Coccomyxa sp. Obi]|nr:Sister chromatid cohesion protein DCC1 [Coccomyxa sp. Obi]
MVQTTGLTLEARKSKELVFSRAVRHDWRLLEVDEKMLQEIVDEGVTIKGLPDEEAVLCTRKGTYAVKHVDTTNSLFLVPPVKDSSCEKVTVAATAVAHLELVLTAPRLGALDRILQATQIRGDDEEEEDQGAASSSGREDVHPHTFLQLLGTAQASEAELRAALQARGAMELDGCWRIISAGHLAHLLEVLLLSAAQHGWRLDAMPVQEACSVLQADGFNPRVAQHCLRLHSALDASTSDTPPLLSLDHRKVCLHFARKLLTQQERWPLDQFLEEWQASVSEGMRVDLSMLRGEARQEEAGGEKLLCHFPAAALPTDPASRFAALFAARPRWELPDLEPYLADLQVPGRSAEFLLLTYARASQENPSAPVVYSAR